MNFVCISVWPQIKLQVDFMFYLAHLEMSHYRVSVKDFRWECFCFLLSFISKIIHPCSVITLPFNSDGLLRRNSLLVFSWMHQLFLFWIGGCVQNFPVCFGACRFGSFGTDLYLFIQWGGAYCINNSGFVIWVSVFLSVVFTFEHGVCESNKDSKFECRSVNDFRHNRTHGQQ